MKRARSYIWIFLYSTIAFFATVLLRGYGKVGPLEGMALSSLAYFIVCFLLTFFTLRKYKNRLRLSFVIILLLTSFIVVEECIMLLAEGVNGYNNLSSLYPLDLCSRLGGILSGYICFVLKSKKHKIVFSTLVFAVMCAVVFILPPKILHRHNFGSYSGRIKEAVALEVIFYDEAGNGLNIKQRGKLVVLDFWSTSCGYCFKAFPKVQQLYDNYKNHPLVDVFAVFCPWGDDEPDSKGAEVLQRENYTFPCLSTKKGDPVLKELGVMYFPTVLIFDETGTLVFRGDIEGATKHISKLVSYK